MSWIKFLAAAAVVMAVCLGGFGNYLLPRIGVDPAMARTIGAAAGGVIIAILYARMKPGPTA